MGNSNSSREDIKDNFPFQIESFNVNIPPIDITRILKGFKE